MIEKDLERIANALDRIAFVLEGQGRLPCESQSPESDTEAPLPAADETQTPAETETPAKPRKAANPAKAKAEEAPEKAPAEETAAPTLEDMRAALVNLQKIAGRDAALGVLAKYQARKVSDIQPDKYADVIADCVKALAGVAA